jgi:hypothetical protein
MFLAPPVMNLAQLEQFLQKKITKQKKSQDDSKG